MLGKLDKNNNTNPTNSIISSDSDSSQIIDSLDNIISYLPADPIRAKIELENLKNNL